MYYNNPTKNDITIITQFIKDEIKNDIINEIRTRQEYNQAFDAYQKGIEIIPSEQGYQPENGTYIKNAMPILEDPYSMHHPSQIFKTHKAKNTTEWTNEPKDNQKNGILYGIGTVALLGILLPQFRQKIINVIGNTTSEGVELIDKARFLVAKAKEDMEDLIAEANFNNAMKKSR